MKRFLGALLLVALTVAFTTQAVANDNTDNTEFVVNDFSPTHVAIATLDVPTIFEAFEFDAEVLYFNGEVGIVTDNILTDIKPDINLNTLTEANLPNEVGLLNEFTNIEIVIDFSKIVTNLTDFEIVTNSSNVATDLTDFEIVTDLTNKEASEVSHVTNRNSVDVGSLTTIPIKN